MNRRKRDVKRSVKTVCSRMLDSYVHVTFSGHSSRVVLPPCLRTVLSSLNPFSSHLKNPIAEDIRIACPRGLKLSTRHHARRIANLPRMGPWIAGVVFKEHSSTLLYVFLTIPLSRNFLSHFSDYSFLLSHRTWDDDAPSLHA